MQKSAKAAIYLLFYGVVFLAGYGLATFYPNQGSAAGGHFLINRSARPQSLSYLRI